MCCIMGGQTDDNVIDGISSDVKVAREKSTFKKLTIKPVQAISDNFGSYIVFKVRGKNGFQLTDDMTFGYMDIENKQETASVMDGYVLKREEDVLYYAVWMMTDGGRIADRQQVFHVTLGDLAYAELYEDGTTARLKADDLEDLENGTYQRALKGKYTADICCKAADASICVEMDGGSVADIHPLGIYVDKYLFDELGSTKLSKEQQKLHVLLKDGTEVSASLCTALGKRNTILRPEKPIDVSQVIGVRKRNQEYYADKK